VFFFSVTALNYVSKETDKMSIIFWLLF